MDDPESHGLVVKALVCRESDAVRWRSDKHSRNVRNNLSSEGITPEGIIREVRRYVRDRGESVVFQVIETRENWKDDHCYYYKVILPLQCYKHGLFVELVLSDDDPDFPCVDLVNAHQQNR